MSDHHVEGIAIRHRQLVLVADRRIVDGSFFGYLEAEKARSLASLQVFDHTDTEFVSRLLVDSCLCEPLALLTITDADPFGMCGVDDELAFDLEIGGHEWFWIRIGVYSF
jgi:hypothetical protein